MLVEDFATPETEVPEPAQSSELELYGNKEVRYYQADAVHLTEQALEQGKNRILIELPTGAGKTITSGLVFSSYRVRKAVGVTSNRKLRILFIAHKHRLLTQAEQAYADASNVEFIPQSAFSDLPVDLEWDITCIDECHHEAMTTIQYHLERLGDKPIIGLTATSDRADGMLLKFEVIINTITREKAVEEGFLAATTIHTIFDTSKKDKTEIIKKVIDEFGSQMKQTMVFVRTKREVTIITDYLISQGYTAIGLLNQTEQELNVILDQFSNKEYQFLVNCNRVSEGVDVRGCTDVILGRQFGSYPMLNQVIGRTARPDSESVVWEFIDPLSARNLDTTVVVGRPAAHLLHYRKAGKWIEIGRR
jgi:superfamily II DNA or RNA helicase